MKARVTLASATCLVALAGLANAQPIIDGQKGADPYQATPIWVQNQPTQFGDNIATGPCTSDVTDAANVTTGLEMIVPLSMLGAGPYNVCIAYISDDFSTFSNQISGGLPNQDELPLGPARGLDLNTYAGNQYITATNVADFTPVLDGAVDAGAGAQTWVQGTATSFGDNADAAVTTSDGSEIDNITAVYDSVNLYLHVAGNMGTGFNGRLAVFIDADGATTGENQLTDVPDISFDRFQIMAESAPAAGDGLIFDAGFIPEHAFFIISGGAPDFYVDYAQINGTGAAGEYAGTALTGATLFSSSGALSLGTEVYIDNSNIGGVSALCPPSTGGIGFAGGSEIDGLYSYIDGTDLYLLVTGNLESNNNKLNLFIDVGDTLTPDGFGGFVTDPGQNQILADNQPVDFGGLLRLGEGDVGDPPVLTGGLIFDTDFSADYWIDFKNFDQFTIQTFANAAVMRQNGLLKNLNGFPWDFGAYDGGIQAGNQPFTFSGPLFQPQTGFDDAVDVLCNYGPRTATNTALAFGLPDASNENLIAFALDNSNTAGLTDVDTADAINVTTGLEMRINLDELGWDGVSEIKVAGFIASDDNGFLSNQFLGGLPDAPPAANLGEPRGLDLSLIAGNQYVVIPVGVVGCSDADITTQGAGAGDPGFGVPDGIVTGADLQYFVNAWVAGDLAIADVTTQGAGVGDPGFGVPDGLVTGADIQYFVNLWILGCP